MEHFKLIMFSIKDWKQGQWWRKHWEGWEKRKEKKERMGVSPPDLRAGAGGGRSGRPGALSGGNPSARPVSCGFRESHRTYLSLLQTMEAA